MPCDHTHTHTRSPRSLNDNLLIDLGVLDANHRRVILNKATSSVDMDFDSMLGDLSSVIKDLETFSVVSVLSRTSVISQCVLTVRDGCGGL